MSNEKTIVSDEISITYEEMKPDSYNTVPPGEEGDE
jgi:hypothetical protein